ncbi:hypothetical protein ACFZAM_02910 [Streptomyces sp. NPDC008079]|uniref:hypothetical protein n=1 Tax=Streptomyces sp. NPDC008079 TaxID=3364806 RepID=UPI0036EEDA92
MTLQNSRSAPALVEGERLIDDPEEILLRQAAPKQLVDEGAPSWEVFRPTSRDEDRLSTRQGSLMTAQQAFEAHVKDGYQSAGTWAVSVAETEAVDARSIDDAELPDSPPAHASIDFRGMASKRVKMSAAIRLADFAHTRGRLHPAEDF